MRGEYQGNDVCLKRRELKTLYTLIFKEKKLIILYTYSQ